MEATDENVQWALEKLYNFAHLMGAPSIKGVVETQARLLLKIIQDNEPYNDPALGEIRRGDWMVERMLETAERWPKPIEFRRIYGDRWRPADGRYANELEAAIGQ